MNIAILHYSVPPVVGGVESVIAHHARLISKNGHSVRLIAARGDALNEQTPLVKIPLADSRHERVIEVKAELDQGKVTQKFIVLRENLTNDLKVALVGVDTLIVHNVCSLNKNLALTAALYELHISNLLPNLIVWHHDLAWTTPRYLPELHDGYPWDLLRTDWGKVSHVVVSALRRDELSSLMKLSPDSIRVIPNGVDVKSFYKLNAVTMSLASQTGVFDSEPILLLPVRVTPRKNIELALNTLAELKKTFPKAALVITGPLGPHNANNVKYFEMLVDLRAQLGLEGSVHFFAELYDGYLSDDVISDFYRISDALFFPSREEGFGIPLIEAAFSHLPVFCADIHPLRELALNDAIYFSPDEEPKNIARMLESYFGSSPRARLAMRVRSSYSWEKIYSLYLAPLLKKG